MTVGFSSIKEIKKNALQVYTSTLIYEAFFIVGAYLIFKGKKYEKFLDKFWNIANPKEGNVTFLNKPPVPTDIMW